MTPIIPIASDTLPDAPPVLGRGRAPYGGQSSGRPDGFTHDGARLRDYSRGGGITGA